MKLICQIEGCGHLSENRDIGLCATHARQQRKASAPKEKPKRQRISKTADPVRDKIYLAIRTLYLAQFPNCAVCEDDGKQETATDIHHKKGRTGDLLLDPRFFIGVCRNCHRWIEENHVDAIEAGWSLSRHAIETV